MTHPSPATPWEAARPLSSKSKWQTWLMQADRSETVTLWHQRAALRLVGRGFREPSHLDGLKAEAAAKFSSDDRCTCILKQAVRVAAKEATVKRARLAKQVMTAKPVVASAAKIADECAKQGEDIPPVWDQGKPRGNIARAAASD